MNKRKILVLATLTLFGMGGIGIGLIYFFHGLPLAEIVHLRGWPQALLYGSLYGLFIAIIGWQLVCMPYLKSTRDFFENLIVGFKLSFVEVLYISFCAGVGEELLFRGAIQPWLGIWITSIIFVAVHGYLNPKNMPLTVYGIFMVFAIAGMGYMAETFGLLSAIVAHFAVDVYMFWRLGQRNPHSEMIS